MGTDRSDPPRSGAPLADTGAVVRIATWNCRSALDKKIAVVEAINADVLIVQECTPATVLGRQEGITSLWSAPYPSAIKGPLIGRRRIPAHITPAPPIRVAVQPVGMRRAGLLPTPPAVLPQLPAQPLFTARVIARDPRWAVLGNHRVIFPAALHLSPKTSAGRGHFESSQGPDSTTKGLNHETELRGTNARA
jgi:hypothetical protein